MLSLSFIQFIEFTVPKKVNLPWSWVTLAEFIYPAEGLWVLPANYLFFQSFDYQLMNVIPCTLH